MSKINLNLILLNCFNVLMFNFSLCTGSFSMTEHTRFIRECTKISEKEFCDTCSLKEEFFFTSFLLLALDLLFLTHFIEEVNPVS